LYVGQYGKPLYDKHFERNAHMRIIDFNQGLDGRLVDKAKMKKICEIEMRPLRTEFDFWHMRNHLTKSL